MFQEMPLSVIVQDCMDLHHVIFQRNHEQVLTILLEIDTSLTEFINCDPI